MKRIAIIDGDTLLWTTALAEQNQAFTYDAEYDVDIDINRCTTEILNRINDILYETRCTSFRLYLTGKFNFRYSILPSYKWRRNDKLRPIALAELKDVMCSKYGAIIKDGFEADDLCTMDMSREEEGIIKVLCHIDKDLNQSHGEHFNFRTNTLYNVSEEEAEYKLWEQVLLGDASDCYLGCPKVGEAKVPSIIERGYCTRPKIKTYSKGVKKGSKEIEWESYYDTSLSIEERVFRWYLKGYYLQGGVGHKSGFDTKSGFEHDIKINLEIVNDKIVVSKKDLEFLKRELEIQYTVARMLKDGDKLPKKSNKLNIKLKEFKVEY